MRKKINKLFAGLASVRMVKNCDFGLENAARGQHFQDFDHSFLLYGPPTLPEIWDKMAVARAH